MRVLVGSFNPVKLAAVNKAVKELCERRPDLGLQFTPAEGIVVSSGVPEQPWELETWEGAFNRGLDCLPTVIKLPRTLILGIESGLFPGLGTGVYDQCVVYAYYEGRWRSGISSGFRLPADMAMLMEVHRGQDDKYTLDHAAKELGYTREERLGYNQGLIGLLSDGWVTREEQTYEAVRNALMALFYKEPTPFQI